MFTVEGRERLRAALVSAAGADERITGAALTGSAALGAEDPAHPALARYTEVARLLTGAPASSIEDGLAWIRETVTLLAVPGLASFGLRAQDAGEVAAKAAASSSMQGNPVTLRPGDLRAIVRQAL